MAVAPADITNRADNTTSVMSSPDPWSAPTLPASRRGSNVESSFTDFPGLSKFKSSVSEMSESVFSEASAARFNELDRQLEQFVLEQEPAQPKKESAENIHTTLADPDKSTPFDFNCHFGWSGDQAEDLSDMPTTKAAFLRKLAEAKDGTSFVTAGMIAYQAEINSRHHHKFKTIFLKHQNEAVIVTNEQLDTINEHFDEVIEEVRSFNDSDANIKEELAEAYKHARPWILRTQRIVSDAHVFYKLNYTVKAANTAANNRKRLHVCICSMLSTHH